MIKVEIIDGKVDSFIKSRPKEIALEFETICENLLEQDYFNASDLACILALACSETSSEKSKMLIKTSIK